jgi:hypothetical protein
MLCAGGDRGGFLLDIRPQSPETPVDENAWEVVAGRDDRVSAPGGHFIPRQLVIRETLDWLDRYLGPEPR